MSFVSASRLSPGLLAAALIAGVGLRTMWLARVPAGVRQDEAPSGYVMLQPPGFDHLLPALKVAAVVLILAGVGFHALRFATAHMRDR